MILFLALSRFKGVLGAAHHREASPPSPYQLEKFVVCWEVTRVSGQWGPENLAKETDRLNLETWYRVTHLVVDWVWLTWSYIVPLSSQLYHCNMAKH